ncbi:MAG TPA: glycine cleavage system protein GcvH [Anaerolineae bacterium]|jgi:glycine cleavage system H protein
MSSKVDPSARYMKTHEWARQEGNEVVIGISDHAQDALSDLVYVELPRIGAKLAKDTVFGVVESVKAASDVYMPVGGTVTATNKALEKTPEVINKDPYTNGWLIKIAPDDLKQLEGLLDATAYSAFLAEEEH